MVYTEFTGSEGISGELKYVQSGREIDFQKNDVNGKIAVIDFRNPPLTIAPLVVHAYRKPGSYNVRFKVIDNYGNVATQERVIRVVEKFKKK